VRFYRRTGPDTAYSNGLIFEVLRLYWVLFLIALPVAAVIGVFQGNVGSLVLLLAICAGGYWGWKRGH
jgi:hypothetical protein